MLGAEGLPHLPAIVHHHLALPVHAHQRVVVLLLDAELADHVALVVLGEFRQVQFLLADFTGVPDDVRQRAVLRIEAARGLDQHHFGEEIVVRIDERQIGGGEFVLDGDGDVFGLLADALHARQQVVVVQVQALCDRPQVLFLGGFARQKQAERGVIVYNDAPVAIQNAPARPGNRHRFDAVLLRPLAVEFRILHL